MTLACDTTLVLCKHALRLGPLAGVGGVLAGQELASGRAGQGGGRDAEPQRDHRRARHLRRQLQARTPLQSLHLRTLSPILHRKCSDKWKSSATAVHKQAACPRLQVGEPLSTMRQGFRLLTLCVITSSTHSPCIQFTEDSSDGKTGAKQLTSAVARDASCTAARRMLRMVGAEVAGPTPAEYNGLHVDRWPLVSWSPSFAQACSSQWRWRQSRAGSAMQSQHAPAVSELLVSIQGMHRA